MSKLNKVFPAKIVVKTKSEVAIVMQLLLEADHSFAVTKDEEEYGILMSHEAVDFVMRQTGL